MGNHQSQHQLLHRGSRPTAMLLMLASRQSNSLKLERKQCAGVIKEAAEYNHRRNAKDPAEAVAKYLNGPK